MKLSCLFFGHKGERVEYNAESPELSKNDISSQIRIHLVGIVCKKCGKLLNTEKIKDFIQMSLSTLGGKMAKLRVNVKRFSRMRDGRMESVDSHTRRITDVGRKGRGPKVIPSLKGGSLGVSFKDDAEERRDKEIALAKKIGEKSVVGKLHALSILTRRTNPTISEKAASDRSFIAKHFEGKKFIR